MKQTKLLTAAEVGERLGMTKQGVLWAVKEQRIEQPKYKLGPFNGWTAEQVDRMAEKRKSSKE